MGSQAAEDDLVFEDHPDVEVSTSMPKARRGKYDWNRLCDGKAHSVDMPKSKLDSFRVQARRRAADRGQKLDTRWRNEHVEDGVTVGTLWFQAVPKY